MVAKKNVVSGVAKKSPKKKTAKKAVKKTSKKKTAKKAVKKKAAKKATKKAAKKTKKKTAKKTAKKTTKKAAKKATKKAAKKTKKKAAKKTTKKTAKKTTAKKTTKKTTAKRQPTTGDAKRGGAVSLVARADIVERLRRLVKATVSDAREQTKWRMPVYSLGEAFCYVGWSPKGVSLGFFRGAELPDPDSLLQGAGRRLRVVRIQATHEIREPPLRRLIEAAAQLAAG
jgi:hypothetical protein